MKFLCVIIPLIPLTCLAGSALDLLKDFNSSKAAIKHEVKSVKRAKTPKLITLQKDNKNYFIIGHAPEILYSVKLIFNDNSFQALNLNFTALKDSLTFGKSYFKFLESFNKIDGNLDAGLYYDKFVRFYTGFHAKIYLKTNGVGFKFQTQDIKNSFKLNYAIYVFKNYLNVLSKSDFLSLYSGFIQKDFVLKNYTLDALLANYKKINRNNAFIGLYYNPNVINLNSIGLETDFKYYILTYFRKF